MLASCIDVEPNHASDQVHPDLLPPSVFRSREGNFDLCELLARGELKFHEELRVADPGEFVDLLFELFIIEMAPSCGLISPLTRDDCIS